MSKRIVTAVALIGAAGLVSGCAFEQPSAGCAVQDSLYGPWQAKYTLKNPADAAKACGQLKGEKIGVWKYVNPKAEAGQPRSRLAIRTAGAASNAGKMEYTYDDPQLDAQGNPLLDSSGNRVTAPKTVDRIDPTHATSLSASLDDQPSAEGFCSAPELAPARVAAKEVRNSLDEVVEPEQFLVSYAFNDVQVYSVPSAPGTQLRGSLVYTAPNADGTECTAEYEVAAIWPAHSCDPEAWANPTEENSADRCAEGSGLNPDFDVVCDTELKACVPAKAIPSFK